MSLPDWHLLADAEQQSCNDAVMQRISVPLPDEAYEALRWRAFHEHQSLALTAMQLLCGALALTTPGRAEPTPVISSQEKKPGIDSTTTAREAKPDFKRGGR